MLKQVAMARDSLSKAEASKRIEALRSKLHY